MVSVLLLTLSVQLFSTTASDVSSEGSNLDLSVTGEPTGNHFQQLVFLSSSFNYQIPVPHIYRKVMIAENLCFISLAEVIIPCIDSNCRLFLPWPFLTLYFHLDSHKVSSLLMISLPTVMQSVTELKLDLHKLSSTKSVEGLTNCVRNLHKYIIKNVRPIVPNHAFNFGPFEQLNQLARKANRSSTDLIREQADRILTLVLKGLHDCYEEVAFKRLYFETFPLHVLNFEMIAQQVNDLLLETFSTCLEYIQVKAETSCLFNASALELKDDLEALLFVDRNSCHFVISTRKNDDHEIMENTILQAYQRRSSTGQSFANWSTSEHGFAYLCISVRARFEIR